MEELGTEMLHAMGEHKDEDERHNRGTDDLDDDDDHHHHKSDRPSGRDCDDDDCGCNCLGAATNTAAESLAIGDAVAFSAEGVENGVETPDPGHHSFKILKTGQYLYNFMVNGAPATAGMPLVFGLTEEGNILPQTMAAGIGLVIGAGIVTLKKGKRIKLVNNSVAPAGGVATLSILPGGAANASLSLTLVGNKC